MVMCHSTLNYQDGEKSYQIILQKDGFPFRFIERRGTYFEGITYNIFNDWGTSSYFEHIKKDQFTNDSGVYEYYHGSFIGKDYDNDHKNVALSFTNFGRNRMQKTYLAFDKLSENDEEGKEVVNKMEKMNVLDPGVREKLNCVMDEFSVEGQSFLETILLYGFTNYSQEEIRALFGIDKKEIDLERVYFSYEDSKVIEKKLFISENG